MLNTVKATLSPSGMLAFEEALPLEHPVPVLVTLLEEWPTTAGKTGQPAVNPLDRPLAGERLEAGGEFDRPRAERPLSAPAPQQTLEGTPLGKRLAQIRQQAIDRGMALLSWEEVNEEASQRRGGLGDG